MDKRPFRYLVKENEDTAGVWEVYKCYGNDARGRYVGSIHDKETLELLVMAPVMRQLQDNIRRVKDPSARSVAVTSREYTQRTLRDFGAAFVGFLRKLS